MLVLLFLHARSVDDRIRRKAARQSTMDVDDEGEDPEGADQLAEMEMALDV